VGERADLILALQHLMLTPLPKKTCEVMSLISQEKSFNLKLSGNEVYYTDPLILLVKNMLCSKLLCEIFLI
jgi:hypothetical protein